MRMLISVLWTLMLTAAVSACHSQPPPPPPRGSAIPAAALERLKSELGDEPIIAFEPQVWPGGASVLPRKVCVGKGERGEAEEPQLILEDGTALYLKDAVPGRRYVTQKGSVLGVLKSSPRRNSTETCYGFVEYHPQIRGLFLNRGDYRLAAVATVTAAAFDSLVALYGLHEILRSWHQGVHVEPQLGMADYPEENVGKFYWQITRRMILEHQTVTFVAWRSPRLHGAQPKDEDAEMLPTPVGQVRLDEDELTVLKGGLQ